MVKEKNKMPCEQIVTKPSELLWNWATLQLLQMYFANFSLLPEFLQIFAAPQRMDSFSHAPAAMH